MKSNLDNVIQGLITAGWANETDGDVESPMGHLALIDMSSEREMMQELISEDESGLTLEGIPAKWFVVREDSDGNVFPEEFENEETARKIYAFLTKRYHDWMSEQED